MIGIYFSGTGNTKFCVEYLLQQIDENIKCYSIEDQQVVETINGQQEGETIVLGYPVYYSNLPKIVTDFLHKNSAVWKGKKVYIVATMGLFSGDGAGVAARILKKYGADVIGGLHLKMPDCIGDVKALKRSLEKNKIIVAQAKRKMENAATAYLAGKPTKEGLNPLYHLAGLFGQRIYFYNKTKNYTNKLKVDRKQCIGCSKCAGLCPMRNIVMEEGKAVSKGACTMCYRCISNCPKQAITLLGKKVLEQNDIERYI